MKTTSSQIATALLIALPFSLLPSDALAADTIELAGDVLEIALPVGAGGMTLALSDWQGSLQLAESEGVTLVAKGQTPDVCCVAPRKFSDVANIVGSFVG